MRLLIVFSLLLLSACEGAFDDPDYQALENEECLSMGLQFGTPAYADCRLRLLELREARDARRNAAYLQHLQNQRQRRKTTDCYFIGHTMHCTEQYN